MDEHHVTTPDPYLNIDKHVHRLKFLRGWREAIQNKADTEIAAIDAEIASLQDVEGNISEKE